MVEKYDLQKGEKYIDEYIDDDGTHMTILKDKNGEIKHGWVMDIDSDLLDAIEHAASLMGQPTPDFIDNALKCAIMKIIEETKTRNAIEEISD